MGKHERKTVAVTIDVTHITDETDPWQRNEDIMTELAIIFRKLSDNAARDAVLPPFVISTKGETLGSIEWEQRG